MRREKGRATATGRISLPIRLRSDAKRNALYCNVHLPFPMYGKGMVLRTWRLFRPNSTFHLGVQIRQGLSHWKARTERIRAFGFGSLNVGWCGRHRYLLHVWWVAAVESFSEVVIECSRSKLVVIENTELRSRLPTRSECCGEPSTRRLRQQPRKRRLSGKERSVPLR